MKKRRQQTNHRVVVILLVFFVFLTLITVVHSQTRQELCRLHSGTADPRIYQCCMAGIEDYDQCIAYTSGGSSSQVNPVTRGKSTSVSKLSRPYRARNGMRQFNSQLGKNAYEALLACRKAGQTECSDYSKMLKVAFAQFDSYLEKCNGNKRCIDRTPNFGIDEIMNAGDYAKADMPLAKTQPTKVTPEPKKPTTVQPTAITTPKILPLPAVTPITRNTNPGIHEQFYELQKQAVVSSKGVTRDIDNNPLSETQLTAGLSKLLPYIKTEKEFPSIKKGQALGFTLDGSYIGEGLLTTSADMDAGMLTIGALDGSSIYSNGQSVGFDKDILDKVPQNLKIEQAYKIGVSNAGTDHFKEALFKWSVAHIPDKKYREYYMMHFGPDGIWKPLPQILDYCDTAKCSYLSDPEGLGYYAIVQEIHPESLDELYFLAAIILGVGAAIGIIILRYNLAQKKYSNGIQKK